MPDFSKYQPPDVYVEQERTSLVNIASTAPSVVGIVGPSLGYRAASQAVTLTGVAEQVLAKGGIDAATVIVRDASGAIFALSDYTIAADGDDATLTTIKRTVDSDIIDGATVSVSYQYTDANFLETSRFRIPGDVAEKYGPGIDVVTNEIVSPLTLAAQIAFMNGANEVVLLTIGDDSGAVTTGELAAGLSAFDALYDVDIIVPLPVGITGTALAPGDTQTVVTNLKTHITSALGNNIFRYGIIGFGTDVTVNLIDVAAGAEEDHIVVASPSRMSYYNGYNRRDIEVGGYYLAAAYAGMMARLPVQMPLTNKQVRGFSGIPGSMLSQMTGSYKNALSAAGVAVTELTRDNRLVVRHGVTSDPSDTMSFEISLVRTKDELVQITRDTLVRSGLIGSWIDDDSIANVKSVVNGCLSTAVQSKIIRDFQGLEVRQQTSDPTVIEVKFQYGPLYPMNYIVVTFGISTTTGEITPVENPLAA